MSAISFAPNASVSNAQPTAPAQSAAAQSPPDSGINPGCYLGAALLSGEDRALCARHLQWLMTLHRPANPREANIIRSLQWSEWRMQRIRRTETFLLALGMRDHAARFAAEPDPEQRNGLLQAAAYEANARLFDQLRRHENQFVREQTNLLKALAELQAQRQTTAMSEQPGASADPSNNAPVDYSSEAPPVIGLDPVTSLGDQTDSKSTGDPSPSGMPKFTGPLRDFKRKQWLRNNGY